MITDLNKKSCCDCICSIPYCRTVINTAHFFLNGSKLIILAEAFDLQVLFTICRLHVADLGANVVLLL